MASIDKIAWVCLEDEGRILVTRTRGKDVYYLPGGKREPGESDVETLVREIKEELSVDLDAATVHHVGTFEAQADGQPDGVVVRSACYAADYDGTIRPDNEIAEAAWLTYADRDRVAPVGRLILDQLHRAGQLRN